MNIGKLPRPNHLLVLTMHMKLSNPLPLEPGHQNVKIYPLASHIYKIKGNLHPPQQCLIGVFPSSRLEIFFFFDE